VRVGERGPVLDQREYGVRPVGDVVARILIADRREACGRSVEFSSRERPGRSNVGGTGGAPEVRLGHSGLREADELIAVSDDISPSPARCCRSAGRRSRSPICVRPSRARAERRPSRCRGAPWLITAVTPRRVTAEAHPHDHRHAHAQTHEQDPHGAWLIGEPASGRAEDKRGDALQDAHADKHHHDHLAEVARECPAARCDRLTRATVAHRQPARTRGRRLGGSVAPAVTTALSVVVGIVSTLDPPGRDSAAEHGGRSNRFHFTGLRRLIRRMRLKPSSYLIVGMVGRSLTTGCAIKRAVDRQRPRFFWGRVPRSGVSAVHQARLKQRPTEAEAAERAPREADRLDGVIHPVGEPASSAPPRLRVPDAFRR
jgi:hypothetical protein